jgi:hypothetical protein
MKPPQQSRLDKTMKLHTKKTAVITVHMQQRMIAPVVPPGVVLVVLYRKG